MPHVNGRRPWVMSVVNKHFLIVALLVVLGGCGQIPRKGGPSPTEEVAVPVASAEPHRMVILPFEEPVLALPESLTPEIVYTMLAAELAAQREDYLAAYRYYLEGAYLAADVRSAEQATRIGLYLKDVDRAMTAARRWVELVPNDLAARMTLTTLYINKVQQDPALEQLKAVLAISKALGLDGFMKAVEAVSRAADPLLGLELMRRLVADYPDDPQGRYAVALTAMSLREFAAAETEIRRLMQAHPDETKGWVLLSNVQRAQGEAERARQTLEQALKVVPNDRVVLTAYARLLMESKSYEQAYEQFRKLDRLAPGDSDVLYTLGILALELERWEKARGYLQQVIATGKRASEATYFMGRSHEREGAVDQAIGWYQQVPEGIYYVESRVGIAALQARRGELDAARDLFQSLRLEQPTRAIELYLIEGEIFRELELHEEIVALFGEALQAYPGNADLLYARALSAAHLGRVDILERDLRAVLEQDPDHADALNALGYTLADQTDRYHEALGYIERALELKPNNPAILDSMGWVQYRLGNHSESLRYLRRALELLPDPEVAAHLGEVLWVSGQQEEARQVWRDALSKQPEHKLLRGVMDRFGQ